MSNPFCLDPSSTCRKISQHISEGIIPSPNIGNTHPIDSPTPITFPAQNGSIRLGGARRIGLPIFLTTRASGCSLKNSATPAYFLSISPAPTYPRLLSRGKYQKYPLAPL